MEEPDRTPSPLAASSSSSSSSPGSRNDEVPGAASTSTSTSSSQSREENHEEEDVQDNINQSPQHRVEGQPSVSYNGSFSRTDEPVVDDTWSCVVVILTLWMFVSMTLILGVYGSVDLKLGPNSSLLVKTNTLLVDYVKVKQLDDTSSGLMLYGFYTEPQLNVVTNWSEIWNISLSHGSHKDRPYYFNKGSQIKISYTLNSSQSSSLILVIAEGSAGLAQWLENPSYPTLSWNTIHGNGLIKQDIKKSTSYYVAVANLNTETVEVQLNLTMRSILYNTTGAYSKCIFTHRQCSLNLFFPTGNSALLTTPGPKEGTSNDEWHVKLSYAPRWIIYIMGIGGMTLLVVSAVHYFNNCQCRRENRDRDQYRETGSRRTPLLAQKDEDVLSWGSSYDSLSQGDEDPEDGLLDGKPLIDGDYNNNNTRRLCAICFDAPRDCFFLPCGHCVSCFACGTRIADASGTCPICRRNMKKVRKIFTV